jgi:hypothetical protein
MKDSETKVDEITEVTAVETLNHEAEARWADRLRVDPALTRALVSFQANKGKAVYRWFKYTNEFINL